MSWAVSAELPRRSSGAKDNFEWGDGIFWTIWVLVERVLVGNGPKCPLSEQSDLQPVRRTINETLWSSVSYSVKRAHVLFCLNDALFAALCLEQAWFAKACWCVSLGRKDFWQVRRWMQQGKSVSRTFTSQRPNAAHEDSFLSHRWICSEVLTGFRIFRPVIDQMHTHIHTHIYLLLVYRSDWIRFKYNYRQTETHNGISQSKISKILCANFRLNALCQDVALKFQDVFCGYVIAIRISLLSFILS